MSKVWRNTVTKSCATHTLGKHFGRKEVWTDVARIGRAENRAHRAQPHLEVKSRFNLCWSKVPETNPALVLIQGLQP